MVMTPPPQERDFNARAMAHDRAAPSALLVASLAMRLDQLLVTRGLFQSREQARRAVMAGEVKVAGHVLDKPGTAVREDAVVEVAARPPFVSRSGTKLAGALDHFGVDPRGWVC